MKLTTMVIVALGAFLVGTMAVDIWGGHGLYGFQALKPVHYLAHDSYDLSAVRRHAHRMHPHFHVEQSQPDSL
jgi:hypothetical protein